MQNRKLMILIGGAGFIGKHLIVDNIKNEDIDILIIDKLQEPIKLMMITHVEDWSNVCAMAIDLEKESLVKKLVGNNIGDFNLMEYKYISIFHLASPVGVNNHQGSTFYDAMFINQNVYQFADTISKLVNPQSNLYFLYTSTSEIFGNYEYIDKEDDIKPNIQLDSFFDPELEDGGFRSDYIYQKLLGENLFSQLNRRYSIKILRLFNIVGRYQDPAKGVFAKFIHAILDQEDCIVSDRSIRCYTSIYELLEYVEDNLIRWNDKPYYHNIVTEEFKTSLTSEELYLYLWGYIKKKYFFDKDLPIKYTLEDIPNEIRVRGKKETMSYSQFQKYFGGIIEDICSEKQRLAEEKLVENNNE